MPNYKSWRKKDPSDPLDQATSFISKATHAILKAKSEELDLPVARLIAIAIDNELDSTTPFNYPCPLPSNTYVEYAYSDEGQKIVEFLKKFPKGTGRDMLMLCRRDIGILDRKEFMLGYRELLELEVIEEFYPQDAKFPYAKNYRYTRLRNVNPKDLARKRKRETEEFLAKQREAEGE